MICRKCGHTLDRHYEDFCNECWSFNANNSTFFEHHFEGNLEYLERMAAKKDL